VKERCFEHGRGKTRQHLTLDEFRELCTNHGETDAAKQESLARLLHNLGAVLHFVDEPRLRDTTVLNPHWVTDGVYKLLRIKDRPSSDGLLTLAEAQKTLPGEPEQAVRYLLRLMERFEMCFAIDEEEGDKPAMKWLLPGAMTEFQPVELGKEWQQSERVRLRYHYDPLSEGVLPRFIVMTHLLSEGQLRWRHGVVLQDGGARALVRKGANPNSVDVTILGPAEERERLVKAVRGYLARIHQDLPEPRAKEFQELSDLPDEFREVRQMKTDERRGLPIMVETNEGDVEKNPTTELNYTSAERPRKSKKRPLRVFLSYAHDDKRQQGLFRKNLIALESDGYITFWDDPNIKPDMEWRSEIDRELESMDIFVGLLTTNFVASKFIQRVEFKRAMERRKDGTTGMWLVLVDDRRIEGTKFENIQVLKPGDKAVSQHKSLKAGFDAVEKELHKLIVARWEALPDEEAIPDASRISS